MAMFFALLSALPLSAMEDNGDNNALSTPNGLENLTEVELESRLASVMEVCIKRGMIDEFKSVNLDDRSYSTIEHLIHVADARSKALALACKLDFGTKTWDAGKALIAELEKIKQEAEQEAEQEQKKRNISRGRPIRLGSLSYVEKCLKKELAMVKDVNNPRMVALHIIKQMEPFSGMYYESLVQVIEQTEEKAEEHYKKLVLDFCGGGNSQLASLKNFCGKQYIQQESKKIVEIKTMLDNELSRFTLKRVGDEESGTTRFIMEKKR